MNNQFWNHSARYCCIGMLLFFCLLISLSSQAHDEPDHPRKNVEKQQQFLRNMDPAALEILVFWFEEWQTDMQHRGSGDFNDKWFPRGSAGEEETAELDEQMRDKFLDLFELGTQGRLGWNIDQNPYENLAYILLFDQFSRNMFRGSAKAYAYDHLARAAANINIQKRFYEYYSTGWQRVFVVFPMMHHENLHSQQSALAYLKLLNEHPEHRYAFLGVMKTAMAHYQLIYMFGRFPYRNERLQRKDTELEAAYIEKHGTYGYIDGSVW